MKRSRKSKSVTWASGLNLCQVRLFLTEDCPSKIGTQVQDHLQKKTSRMLHHLTGKEFSDLPPGFEGNHLNLLKEELSCIPRIEWKCPPKMVMNYEWHVTAGEESLEAEAQKVREMRVLEAVFPRHSAIPPSPCISLDVEEESYNCSVTPMIPLTPIEEEAVVDAPSNLSAPPSTLIKPQLAALSQDLSSPRTRNSAQCDTPDLEPPASEKPIHGLLPHMSADLMAAASAAVTALAKTMEQGSLIDTGLLVKILSDPKMIEKLINERQTSINMTSAPIIVSKPAPSSCNKSTMLSVPMPANECLQSIKVQPTVTRVGPPPETKPLTGLKQAAPISPPRQESIRVPIPRPAVPNMHTMPDQVQSTVSSMPAQSKSFVELKSNPVPATLGMMPVQQNLAQANAVTMNTNPVKYINYIKNLIREHGSDKQNQNMSNNGPHANHILNKELAHNGKPKFQKPCMFYRSPKGCRNGSNCPYQHDLSFQYQTGGILEAPYAKRMKLDGEITGRT